ncbi:hypothetical protein [Nocardia sp. NPDC004860]|uniref:hypothetical protein n=1 Tax=Nocardia sp. NPDC004860 TaxID=3154557 RepID=UPI0033B5D307
MKVFEEKRSGKLKIAERPGLLAALDYMRPGDMLTERQVCINLLQWYLRDPRSEENERNTQSEREIRQTITGILTQRLHRPTTDPKSWAGQRKPEARYRSYAQR